MGIFSQRNDMVRIRYHGLDMAVAAETGGLSFQLVDDKALPERDTLYQLSRLSSLTEQLEYEGLVKAADLEKYGDFGVGAPCRLGELNILDGKVYQALYDGSIIETDLTQTIPFAQLTHFKTDFSHQLGLAVDIADFEAQLDQLIEPHGKDVFYAVRIHGQFPMMLCRSVYFQKKPFKSMAKIMAEDQVKTTWHDVSGTLISIYGPDFMHPVSPTGWHFHFISDDKKLGGHVLDLQVASASADFDRVSRFVLMLP
ncbi:MAG: acetolactate decarboxylase [Oxalobacter sp.]